MSQLYTSLSHSDEEVEGISDGSRTRDRQEKSTLLKPSYRYDNYTCMERTKYWFKSLPWFIKMAAVVGLLSVIVIITLLSVEASGAKADQSKRVKSDALLTTANQNQDEQTNDAAHDGVHADFPGPAVNSYEHGGVASDSKKCSSIGTEMLVSGGSSVDAAIATLLCIGIKCSGSTGVGGGSAMLIYDTPRGGLEKEYVVLDSREQAPLLAHWDMYNTTSSSKGGLAIAVPGEVKGYHEAWLRFGRLDWASLFHPTINMCREGFVIERDLANKIQSNKQYFTNFTTLGNTFTKPDGTLYQEGDIIKLPTLADTLEKVAKDPNTYYNGTLAKDIVKDIQEEGGIISEEDLRRYKIEWRKPLRTSLRSLPLDVVGVPPPFSGSVAQYILNILDGYNMTQVDKSNADEYSTTIHRFVESLKFAYARRSDLSDPKFNNVTELIANLTSHDFADETRKHITDDKTHPVSYYHPDFVIPEDGGTSHVCIKAKDGSAVSVTSTINGMFGSKVQGRRTGIIFNNEMDDFSKPTDDNIFHVPPSRANFIEPSKRPVSSMTPLFLVATSGKKQVDGDGLQGNDASDFNQDGVDEIKGGDNITHIIGGAGGSTITTQVAYVLFRHLWLNDPLNVALQEFRVHHQLVPNQLLYEDGFKKKTLWQLRKKGHELLKNKTIAVVNAISDLCPRESFTGPKYWTMPPIPYIPTWPNKYIINGSLSSLNEANSVGSSAYQDNDGSSESSSDGEKGFCLQTICDGRKGGGGDGY